MLKEYQELRWYYTVPLKCILFAGLLYSQRNFRRLTTPVINRIGLDILQAGIRGILTLYFTNMVVDSFA